MADSILARCSGVIWASASGGIGGAPVVAPIEVISQSPVFTSREGPAACASSIEPTVTPRPSTAVRAIGMAVPYAVGGPVPLRQNALSADRGVRRRIGAPSLPASLRSVNLRPDQADSH